MMWRGFFDGTVLINQNLTDSQTNQKLVHTYVHDRRW